MKALVDGEAFRARIESADATHDPGNIAAIDSIGADAALASKLCAWLPAVADYRLLRVHQIAGVTHIVFRWTNGLTVKYHELALGRSRSDHRLRFIDLLSYYTATWASEEIARAAAQSDGASAIGLAAVNALQDVHPDQALATFEQLPAAMRGERSMQAWHVNLAHHVSPVAYRAALDELEHRFPNDPRMALILVDGHVMRGDIAAALHDLDVLESSIGHDPFLDGTRAMLLAKRHAPGDLDAAEAHAEVAAQALPTLVTGTWGHFMVAVARERWDDALTRLDEIEQRFGLRLSSAALDQDPFFATFLAAPEVARWRASH